MSRRAVVLLLLLSLPAPAALAQGEAARARDALLAGRYEEAIEGYTDLARAAPSSAGAVRGLVEAQRAVGRYAEAEDAIRRFTERNPGSPALWTVLGDLRAETGRWEEADTAYRRALDGGAEDTLSARLGLAVLAYDRGERDTAMAAFERFIDTYNRASLRRAEDLAAVATALRYLGTRDHERYPEALRVYDEAIARDPTDLDLQVLVGELFLDRYVGSEARAAFAGVLERNPRHPGALLGLARVERFGGSGDVVELVERCLAVNPRSVPARVLLATLYVESEDYGRALEEVDQALAVHPRSLEALAVGAGARLLQGDRDGYERARRRVLTLNPRYAAFYTTMAELSGRNRLYREAADFARAAVEVDSTAWRGHAVLGVNELRLGRMEAGRAHLEAAFRGDPYDVWTMNTLDLLDTLARYDTLATGRFRFAFDPAESAVLGLYAAPLAEEAYRRLRDRYGWEPPDVIRVEVYPSHADFSVRTVGLTGLGALGVSFGSVLAMDSPSARPVGDFHWGSTLWHEIAHAFHLGMSEHRVPRWFTEGLAVYEERLARPGWGDRVSPGFLVAYRDDRLHPVSSLNSGFLRPAYPEQVGYSYYQASLVCELIAQEHGTEALAAMLAAYRDGASTEQAFRSVLATSLEAFDERFDRYLRTRFAGPLDAMRGSEAFERHGEPDRARGAARARPRPDDFMAQLATGRELAARGELAAARGYFERAAALFPEYTGPENPYGYLAAIARDAGDLARAEEYRETLTGGNAGDLGALVGLADMREALADRRGAAAALDGAVLLNPYDAALHQRLASLAAAAGDWGTAVRERRAVLALAPVDRADAWYQLARALHGAGDAPEARRAVLRALEIAPHFAAAQDLLLELYDAP